MRLEDIKDPKQRAMFEAALNTHPHYALPEQPHVFVGVDLHNSPAAQPKHDPVSGLAKRQKSKKQNPQRSLVRVTCYRVRRQDPDNAIIKWHLDALRLARIIEDDTEDHIKLEISPQVQVRTKAEEKVVIEIEPLP